MNRLFISMIVFLLCMPAFGQDEVPLTKQEKKAIRKEEKKQREKVMAVNTAQAIKSRNFVLKAQRISGRYGYVTMVDPTINFISVQGDIAYVQLGSESGLGYNGVGGVTLKGTVTSFDVKQDEKSGSYFLMIHTSGTGGSLSISMQVNVIGDMATATVTTNWGSTVTFSGDLYPHSSTRVYKGTESY